MIETRYPFSLKQALAYLESSPHVILSSHFGGTITRSEWWYIGRAYGVLHFAEYPLVANNKEPRYRLLNFSVNGGDEAGLEFQPNGFLFVQGKIRVFVQYTKEGEAL